MSPLGDRFARSVEPSDLIAPAFVIACLVMGGATREGEGMHMALSFAALCIIGWLWIVPGTKSLSAPARSLRMILVIAFFVVIAQLMPLPPGVWTMLPGREPVVRGFELIGAPLPWLPVSLAPELTLRAIATVLPAVAVAGLMLTGSRRSVQLSLAAVIVVAIASVVLGFVQPSTGLYLYDRTNRGQPTGLFANSNHLATLLLVTIPIVAMAITRTGAGDSGSQRRAALRVIMAGAGVLLVAGLLTNGSRAGLMLALPVVAASAALVWLGRIKTLPALWTWLGLGGAAVLASLLVLLSATNMLLPAALGERITSRGAILATTAQAAIGHAPIGSGIGSFPVVYPGFEPTESVGAVFVNHVHNDYAELLVETGVGGLMVMILLLTWWARRAAQLWSGSEPGILMGRVGSIGSAAILLHSIVDYPARSIAIMILLALFLALMAQPALHTGVRIPGKTAVKVRHRTV